MNNSPDYTATLQGWWDNAERATPNVGDIVIACGIGVDYGIHEWTQDDEDGTGESYERRVLRRAAPHDRQVQRAYLLDALVHIGYVDEDSMGEVPDAELDVLIEAVLDR